MTRKLVSSDDLILRQSCEPIYDISNNIDYLSKLVDDMISIMEFHNGVGIAAPQLGIPLQIMAMYHKASSLYDVCINPTYKTLTDSTQILSKEGCLSLPGVWLTVRRWNKIIGQWTTMENKSVEFVLSGDEARIFQHEVDHLRGILITDVAVETPS